MAPLEFKSAELVLFAGGAVLTVAVLVIAVLLYRMASREHARQLERERCEQDSKARAEEERGG